MKYNEEYEYSFKVDNIDKYIKYCEDNNYKKINQNRQIRKLYKNETDIMARITTTIKDGKEEIIFDFKANNETEDILKIRKETLPLKVKKEDLEKIESIIEFLNLKLLKTLDRTRTVYEKENIKFEIDKYTSPEVMNVIGIEGNKEEVDKVYKKVK